MKKTLKLVDEYSRTRSIKERRRLLNDVYDELKLLKSNISILHSKLNTKTYSKRPIFKKLDKFKNEVFDTINLIAKLFVKEKEEEKLILQQAKEEKAAII